MFLRCPVLSDFRTETQSVPPDASQCVLMFPVLHLSPHTFQCLLMPPTVSLYFLLSYLNSSVSCMCLFWSQTFMYPLFGKQYVAPVREAPACPVKPRVKTMKADNLDEVSPSLSFLLSKSPHLILSKKSTGCFDTTVPENLSRWLRLGECVNKGSVPGF